MNVNYVTITETPGVKASQEQIKRLYQRYHFAYQFCKDKDVLEIACGAGQGLGYLAKTAKLVVGSDIDSNNLKFAQNQYDNRSNIKLEKFNAQNIPFSDKSFDVVILYEAIYYLENPEVFIEEAHRVLRDNGLLIVCAVNKDWIDFNPSPYSIKYYSVPELLSLLKNYFYKVDIYGGFLVEAKTLKNNIVGRVKRTAISLHLMPKTMRGKELLKRLFFGKLYPLPAEIKEGMSEYIEPVPIASDSINSSHKVIFAIAHKERRKI